MSLLQVQRLFASFSLWGTFHPSLGKDLPVIPLLCHLSSCHPSPNSCQPPISSECSRSFFKYKGSSNSPTLIFLPTSALQSYFLPLLHAPLHKAPSIFSSLAALGTQPHFSFLPVGLFKFSASSLSPPTAETLHGCQP